MTKLRAFHNDPARRRYFLARVKAHAKADEIIKGLAGQKLIALLKEARP